MSTRTNSGYDVVGMASRLVVTILLALFTLSCGGDGGNSFVPRTPPPPPPPQFIAVPVVQLHADPFTNTTSQHATEVEPSAFAVGSTIVAVFQVGRRFGGASTAIGFATSTDAGRTWVNGFLPNITVFQNGPWSFVTDPVVTYDAAHGMWIASTLAISSTDARILASRSPDGRTWSDPVNVSATPNADKNWTVCDNFPSSPFFGHCYTEWDDPTADGQIWMSTSTDGGASWGPGVPTAGNATGIGGQPVVLPDGRVIVPILNATADGILAYSSSDGGATWSAPLTIATVVAHRVAANLRALPLPSAQADAAGNIYVVWQDCRFRVACAGNDVIMIRSSDGGTWSAPARLPIDTLATSTADYFLPAIGADAPAGGGATRLAVTYYFYQQSACDATTCRLHAAIITSNDAGASWSPPVGLAGPMPLAWLPNTSSGLMVGDYFATVFANGLAFPVIAIAHPPNGAAFDEAIYTVASGVDPTRVSATAAMRAERVRVTRSPDRIERREHDESRPAPKPPPRRRH